MSKILSFCSVDLVGYYASNLICRYKIRIFLLGRVNSLEKFLIDFENIDQKV